MPDGKVSLCCSEVQGSRVLSTTSIWCGMLFWHRENCPWAKGCIEEHWSDPEFAVLKVDLKNAFNVVSRQALLVEVKNHFPKLLPWACWCYGLHPLLWQTMGHLQSESGVQQGDPLGPLFFDLILNLLISEISEDEVCSHLQFHAWYRDDGVLAGPISAGHRALALIKAIGPSLGLFLNVSECEVFSRSDLS